MLNKRKNEALALDDYGTRLWRTNRLNKADSIYASSYVAYIATILFCIVDFACLRVVWNTVQTEDPYFITLIALSCAVSLDMPLAIAGNALKSYHQKLKDKTSTVIVMVLAITTFLITFIFAFWFRVETKDLTFDISSNSTLTNTLAETTVAETKDSNAVVVAALFNAIIPFATSIASFCISYFAANPLAIKIDRLNKAIITLDSNLTEIEQACQEAEGIQNYKQYLLAREEDMYQQFCESSEAQGVIRKQAVRFVIMEMLGTPDDITILTESGNEVNQKAEALFSSESNSSAILSA